MAGNKEATEEVVLVNPYSTGRTIVPPSIVETLLASGFTRASEASTGAEVPGEPKGNASRDDWAAWAEHLGLEVPEDAKRDDIKVLVAQHGAPVPTEPEGDDEDDEPEHDDEGAPQDA